MATSVKIQVKEILGDIRAGVSNSGLMEKYKLTPKGLDTVLTKLAEAGAIPFDRLQDLSESFHDDTTTVPVSNYRLHERDDLDFHVPVYEKGRPEVRGIVLDICEKGLGVSGLAASVDEVKTLVIRVDKLFQMEAVICRVRCRWVRASHHVEKYRAGFEVERFLQGDLKTFQDLVRSLTLEERIALKDGTR